MARRQKRKAGADLDGDGQRVKQIQLDKMMSRMQENATNPPPRIGTPTNRGPCTGHQSVATATRRCSPDVLTPVSMGRLNAVPVTSKQPRRPPLYSGRSGLSSLNVGQRRVYEAAVEHGKNIYISGAAGTGKSALIAEIVHGLREKWHGEEGAVCVTAPTSLAAIKAGGQTIHSWAGIGVEFKGPADKDKACHAILTRRTQAVAKRNWSRARALIIDEISMVTRDLLDLLDGIGRQVRLEIEKDEDSRNAPERLRRRLGSPFGGVQLIVCGDFMQLPPIADKDEEKDLGGSVGSGISPATSNGRDYRWAFKAKCWPELFHRDYGYACRLTEVFRQKDKDFRDMLEQIRVGAVLEETEWKLRALRRPLSSLLLLRETGMHPTELFPRKCDAAEANENMLKRLPGETLWFDSTDAPENAPWGRLEDKFGVQTSLSLKVGAQVMLLKKIEEGLVNGIQGVVRGFLEESEYSAAEASGDIQAAVDALAHAPVRNHGKKRYPVVMFTSAMGEEQWAFCKRVSFEVKYIRDGEMQSAVRHQVPLTLSWAMSIHKAQGQTLEFLQIDLRGTFTDGQTYTALSRATDISQMRVLNYSSECIRTNPEALRYTSSLRKAEELLPKPSSLSGYLNPPHMRVRQP